jgi:diguanylate cyclase (GGDEF)-like protein
VTGETRVRARWNWPLLAVVLSAVVMVAGWLVADPQGTGADRAFYLLCLATSVAAGGLLWRAAVKGTAKARRPWRWSAMAYAVLALPQPIAIADAALHDGVIHAGSVIAVLSGRMLWTPLILLAILTFPMKALTARQRIRFGADIATVVGGGFVISWYFQLGPALTRDAGINAEAGLAVAYTVTDLVLIFGVFALLMRDGITSMRGPLPIFLAGLITFLAGDTIYAHVLLGGPATWTAPLSLTLNCANLIMAAAAAVHIAQPGAIVASSPDRARPGIAYLPYAALLAGYGMLLIAAARQSGFYPWGGLVAGVSVMTAAVVLRQVTAMRENHGLIMRDHLTGLANRVSVGIALETAVRRHDLTGVASAIMLIDLDGFKKINDTRGHETGDALLVAFAAVLERTVRGSDTAARVGGDEFVVVLDRPGSEEQALAVARRILEAAADPVVIDGVPTRIRASIGVAMTEAAADVATVRHRADMAMYSAKRQGRHDAEPWRPDLLESAAEQDSIEADLADATAAGQLRVVYQPIVDLASAEITGLEALVRWEHPVHGMIFPDRFIPVAERTGAIEQIGLWVLAQAATQVEQWQRQIGRHLYVSVNLSARQLENPALSDQVRSAVAASGLDPRNLVLELTETALVNEADATEPLQALRALGARIAVDDFGTGYSSLRYLTRLPVDILKLDRCFVSELNGDPQGSAVAEAVLRLAQALNLDTVAEGIEEQAQATELALLGYHSGQGYYYAKPMTPEAMTARLLSSVRG